MSDEERILALWDAIKRALIAIIRAGDKYFDLKKERIDLPK